MSSDAMQRAKELRAAGLRSFSDPRAAPIVTRKASAMGKFQRAAHGSVQISKTVLHIGIVPAEIHEARAERGCRRCPHAVLRGSVLISCTVCKCKLRYKLRQANERCPLGDKAYPAHAHEQPRWTQYLSPTVHGLPPA